MKSIEEILNANVKVTEKLSMLGEYEMNQKYLIQQAIEAAKKGYKYCPICKEYYREDSFAKTRIPEKRNICKDVPLGEWEDFKYEEIAGVVTYELCPLGHRTEISFDY